MLIKLFTLIFNEISVKLFDKNTFKIKIAIFEIKFNIILPVNLVEIIII
jgi:hypothetical protein